MKKTMLLLCACLAVYFFIGCGDDGSNSPSADVYVGGYCDNNPTDQVKVPGYWKNGVWNELPALDATKSSFVNSIAVSGGNVYAGGYSTDSGNIKVAGYWKNGTWTPLTPLDPGQDSIVNSIIISGNEIYACGYSKNSSEISTPVLWINGFISSLPVLSTSKVGTVNSMTISGSIIYAAGSCINASDVLTPVCWQNGTLNPLSVIDNTKFSNVSSIAASDNKIVIGGWSIDSGNKSRAVYWENGQMNILTENTTDASVNSVFLAGLDVYAAGSGVTGSGVNVAMYWKDKIWNGLPSVTGSMDSYAYSIIVYGHVVFAAGECVMPTTAYASGRLYIAGYWKNGTWIELAHPHADSHSNATSIVAGN